MLIPFIPFQKSLFLPSVDNLVNNIFLKRSRQIIYQKQANNLNRLIIFFIYSFQLQMTSLFKTLYTAIYLILEKNIQMPLFCNSNSNMDGMHMAYM